MTDWLKEQFSLLRDFYRREYGAQVRMTAFAFGIILVLAFVAALLLPAQASRIVDYFASAIQESGILDETGTPGVMALFANNLRATGLAVLMGFVPYLYLTAFPLGVNAGILGLFGGYYITSGHSIFAYLAGILPHGIFELPAIVLSLSMGLYLCRSVVDYMRNNVKGVMAPLVANLARVFVLNVVPLLLIASVIEVYVTPALLALFM